MAQQFFETKDLNAYYGKSHVLRDVSIHVNAGERVAILGRNGMGKSTLLKSIMKLSSISVTGEIEFEGKRLDRLPTYSVAQMGIGYVPQGWMLFRSLSVEEHLFMAYRKGDGVDEWTPERVLSTFPEIARRRKVGGRQLSGGEQQILSIGRALVTNSKLLLMDEPSEGVSAMVLDRVQALCEELSASGKSVLLVEQNLSLALRVAQRLYVLVNGRIVHEDFPDDFSKNEELQARHLGV